MSGEHTLKAVRGSFIDVTRTAEDPEEIASALRFVEDGLLLIRRGKSNGLANGKKGNIESLTPSVSVTIAENWSCRDSLIRISTTPRAKWSVPMANSCWNG